jgi:hypothetical protein
MRIFNRIDGSSFMKIENKLLEVRKVKIKIFNNSSARSARSARSSSGVASTNDEMHIYKVLPRKN